MSYREPDDASTRARAASERLAKLAAAGERKRRALATRKSAEALATGEAERAEMRRNTRVAVTRASLLANPWFFGFVSPAVAGLAVAGAGGNSVLVWAGASAFGMVVSHSLGRVLGDRAVQREHEWASDLPFELVGYFEVLGRDTAAEVFVTLTFAEDPANPELLANVVAAFDGEAKVNGAISRQLLCIEGVGPIRRWFRRLVGRVLLPLHAAHPLVRVHVAVSLAGD